MPSCPSDIKIAFSTSARRMFEKTMTAKCRVGKLVFTRGNWVVEGLELRD